MTTATHHYGLTWTDRDGVPQASAGAYAKPAAKRRRKALKETGCTRVEIVPVKPGELPELPA
ncbi:hypothetical protein ACFY30_19010 [Streptomyces sp. NPDC000345]|uniref:hypothetical protein n=1 Tax=Streptomyces sp. NPDC000345 TaxID=3364537 RepID=UPI003699C542